MWSVYRSECVEIRVCIESSVNSSGLEGGETHSWMFGGKFTAKVIKTLWLNWEGDWVGLATWPILREHELYAVGVWFGDSDSLSISKRGACSSYCSLILNNKRKEEEVGCFGFSTLLLLPQFDRIFHQNS